MQIYYNFETYWLDFHKLIYIAFKLLDKFPMYNRKPLTFPFLLSVMYVITCACVGRNEPTPTTAPQRIDGKWLGKDFLLGCSSLIN
jgi:hypothetical protein